MSNAPQRDQVFISYSRKDKKLFDQLQTFLKPLVRDKKISVWNDTKIKSGDAWREEIKTAIASAKVAVLLVSSDFLDSDFIAEHELPPILEAAQKDGLTILWIAVRFSGYEETEIAHYQAVNDPTRPLAGISGASRERELVRICKEIKAATLKQSTSAAATEKNLGTRAESANSYYVPAREELIPLLREGHQLERAIPGVLQEHGRVTYFKYLTWSEQVDRILSLYLGDSFLVRFHAQDEQAGSTWTSELRGRVIELEKLIKELTI